MATFLICLFLLVTIVIPDKLLTWWGNHKTKQQREDIKHIMEFLEKEQMKYLRGEK